MANCLCCYQPLREGERDFHPLCSQKFFGTRQLPKLDYTLSEIDSLASQIINEQTSLTGVQPKLSLHLNEHRGSKRLTIVGLWGGYIMKPQSEYYEQLPEVEDLTMHLAEIAHIDVVPHTLMRMADNSLCYITKRIDRNPNGEKIAMEDMCQLTERQTEYKYKSSYERIGKAILQYSSMPQMDIVNYFETVLFSWITGNNDMHLKNFSIYEPQEKQFRLSPAYDLINARIINPSDTEELALSLNGKKKNIKRNDFLQFGETIGISSKIAEKLFNKYIKLSPKFIFAIENSFLKEELKLRYKQTISNNLAFLSPN